MHVSQNWGNAAHVYDDSLTGNAAQNHQGNAAQSTQGNAAQSTQGNAAQNHQGNAAQSMQGDAAQNYWGSAAQFYQGNAAGNGREMMHHPPWLFMGQFPPWGQWFVPPARVFHSIEIADIYVRARAAKHFCNPMETTLPGYAA